VLYLDEPRTSLINTLGLSLRLRTYNVTQVELAALVAAKADEKPKSVTVRITHPNSCSLKYDDVDLKLREMLVASGIEPREPTESVDVAEAEAAELARCEFLARRENVLLLGNSGTGKTHIALALGLAACQRGHRVRFTTAAALVSELIEARDEKKLLRFQKQIASYELLIVDELGFVPLSKTGAELLFEMLSQRYERGSTMVTSNLPFQEWTEVLGSERLTGALLDRLTHHVHILEMNADSYRLKQSRRKRRASSATLQSPFSPEIPTISCPAVALFCSAPLAWFYSALDSLIHTVYY
jgi:DNA replication protein DnaC